MEDVDDDLIAEHRQWVVEKMKAMVEDVMRKWQTDCTSPSKSHATNLDKEVKNELLPNTKKKVSSKAESELPNIREAMDLIVEVFNMTPPYRTEDVEKVKLLHRVLNEYVLEQGILTNSGDPLLRSPQKTHSRNVRKSLKKKKKKADEAIETIFNPKWWMTITRNRTSAERLLEKVNKVTNTLKDAEDSIDENGAIYQFINDFLKVKEYLGIIIKQCEVLKAYFGTGESKTLEELDETGKHLSNLEIIFDKIGNRNNLSLLLPLLYQFENTCNHPSEVISSSYLSKSQQPQHTTVAVQTSEITCAIDKSKTGSVLEQTDKAGDIFPCQLSKRRSRKSHRKKQSSLSITLPDHSTISSSSEVSLTSDPAASNNVSGELLINVSHLKGVASCETPSVKPERVSIEPPKLTDEQRLKAEATRRYLEEKTREIEQLKCLIRMLKRYNIPKSSGNTK